LLRTSGYYKGTFGYRWKKRRKDWLEPSIDAVLQAKSGKPIAQEDIKAAGNHQVVAPTYNQAYRAVTWKSSLVKLQEKESY
jgi:hypothetical protein